MAAWIMKYAAGKAAGKALGQFTGAKESDVGEVNPVFDSLMEGRTGRTGGQAMQDGGDLGMSAMADGGGSLLTQGQQLPLQYQGYQQLRANYPRQHQENQPQAQRFWGYSGGGMQDADWRYRRY
jgi:hypothetical protein